jgi:hypothetical protein
MAVVRNIHITTFVKEVEQYAFPWGIGSVTTTTGE